MTRRKTFIFSLFSLLAGGLGLAFGCFLLFRQFVFNDFFEDSSIQKTNPTEGRVLYISSYDPNYSASEVHLEGIKQAFEENNILFEVFYMDMKNYYTKENFLNFYVSAKNKIASVAYKFDAVLVSDDAALIFARTYQDELFKGIPIVFFGINDINQAKDAVKNPYITGFGETIFVSETLEIAIEQNPQVECIVGIFDDSISGQGDKIQFENAIKEYPNLEYKYINISKTEPYQLAWLLMSLPKNSVILCLSYLQDYAHAHDFTTYELVTYILNYASRTPVYRTNNIGMGAGFVGGKFIDYRQYAYNAALTVVDILNGRPVSEIPLQLEIQGEFVFDYAVIKKMNIGDSSFPENSTFINKHQNIFQKNINIIFPFIVICCSLFLFLVVSSVSYRKTKNINGIMMIMNKQIRQTNKDLLDSKQQLTYVANNDKLTGLPNRTHGEQEIRRIIKTGIPFSLFLMDVDDFKNYNDTYTHACGDYVLQEYGRRLLSLTFNNQYFAARYGGDEFILVHKCGHIEKNGPEIEKIRQLLNEPIYFNNMKVDLTATLGYTNSSPEMTYDDFIINADIAMYEGKKQGKRSIVAFSPEMKESILRKNKIVEILKEECSSGGFDVRYQPQVNVHTGEISGFEALVRLQNYSIGPGEFIPVAEKGGFIAQIGRIVTEKVLNDMANWRQAGMEMKKVAINYSNGQLLDEEYIPFLRRTMEKYQIPPEFIEIEITESLFIGKIEKARQLFNEFSEIGVSIALDDFGTGYSSLSYLTFLPAQKVKIDKSLVDNYLVDGKETFIENIVHLVHDLGMKLTVEGVEQKWQYDKLSKMGCDFVQGYFFSKPMLPNLVPDFSVVL